MYNVYNIYAPGDKNKSSQRWDIHVVEVDLQQSVLRHREELGLGVGLGLEVKLGATRIHVTAQGKKRRKKNGKVKA